MTETEKKVFEWDVAEYYRLMQTRDLYNKLETDVSWVEQRLEKIRQKYS
jgi:hypothetical protein